MQAELSRESLFLQKTSRFGAWAGRTNSMAQSISRGLASASPRRHSRSKFEGVQIGEALPKTIEDWTGRLVVVQKGVTDTLLPGLPQQCRPGNRSFTQFNRMIGAGIGRIAGGEACEAVLKVNKPYALFISPRKEAGSSPACAIQ